MKTHHVPPRTDHNDNDYGRLDLAVVHL
jgi:stage V sporulation protein R